MPLPDPTTQTLDAAEVRRDLDSVLSRVARHEAQVVVEQDGVPVAAIISTDDLERLRRFDAEWRRRFEIIESMRASFGDISDEQLLEDVAEVIAASRRARHGCSDSSSSP